MQSDGPQSGLILGSALVPRRLSGYLALESDCAAEDNGERQLEQDADGERVEEVAEIREKSGEGGEMGEDGLLPPVEASVIISRRGRGRHPPQSPAIRRPGRCCAPVLRAAQ